LDDDLLKDLASQILSGSLNIDETKTLETEEEYNFTTQAILDSVINSDWIDEQLTQNVKPYYCLSDVNQSVKHYWVLNAVDRTMSKVPAQTELIIIERTKNNKSYCMIGDSMFLISNSLICYVGWN